MTDVQIAQLIGMETWCRLSDVDPKEFEPRVECSDYPSISNRNDISVLIADGISMKQVKEDLRQSILTDKIPHRVKNLVGSSRAHSSRAYSKFDLALWTIIIIIVVSIIIWLVVSQGLLNEILDLDIIKESKHFVFL